MPVATAQERNVTQLRLAALVLPVVKALPVLMALRLGASATVRAIAQLGPNHLRDTFGTENEREIVRMV